VSRPHTITVAVLALACMLLSSCAAILGGGTSQAVSFESKTAGATYKIKSSSGLDFGSGSIPNTVRLARRNEYQVEVAAPGYKPQSVVLTKSLNGWVWGNLIVGWLVGFVVDFASGSAYKLEPAVVSLDLQTATLEDGRNALFAVVSLRDKAGHEIQTKRVEMEPEPTGAENALAN